MRGPRTRPSSTASASPPSAPAASRIVVKPRCSIASSTFAAWGQKGDRAVRQAGARGIYGEDVDVRVDQPRHQGTSREIDRLGGHAFDRPVGNFPNMPALDQDMVV